MAQSYLKAWCDPTTPDGQEPYVWVFKQDGSGDPRRKAPVNIFHETDMYTIHRAAGERDLVLEHGLAGLESQFVVIRDTKLARQEPLTREEHLLLCAFIAAAHARTRAQRDHLGTQFTRVLHHMDQMIEGRRKEEGRRVRDSNRGTSLPLDSMGRPGRGGLRGGGLTYDDVKRLAEKPMQTTLATIVRTLTPLLTELDPLVLTTPGPAFITSDRPCVWLIPLHTRDRPFSGRQPYGIGQSKYRCP